jgi:putative chitinase
MTGLTDEAKFLGACRAGIMAPSLEPGEIQGLGAITEAMTGTPLSHCAYALATAFHETARTMQPVREAFWLSEDWRKRNLRYWPWYGRGFVQLTWQTNYKRADDELKLGGTLVARPDRAMEPAIAAQVMRRGMTEGWFTGHALKSHLPDWAGTRPQFEGARAIINGTDRKEAIAAYAMQFQDALKAGGLGMKLPPIAIPRISDHGSEIVLLWSIAVGVLAYMAFAAGKGQDVDTAACLVVLTAIISAVKERWTQRSVDRMGASLANSPPAEPPTPAPDQPAPVERKP